MISNFVKIFMISSGSKTLYVCFTKRVLRDAKFSVKGIPLNQSITKNLFVFSKEVFKIKTQLPKMYFYNRFYWNVGDVVIVFSNHELDIPKIFGNFEKMIVYNNKVLLITLNNVFEIAAIQYMINDKNIIKKIKIVNKNSIFFLKNGIPQINPDIPEEYKPIKYLSSLKAYYKTKNIYDKSDFFFQLSDGLPQQYNFYYTMNNSLLDQLGINYFTYYSGMDNPKGFIYILAENNKEIESQLLNSKNYPDFSKHRYFITIKRKKDDKNVNCYLESDFINYTVGIPMQFPKEGVVDVFKRYLIKYKHKNVNNKGLFYKISCNHPFSQYEINLLQQEMENNHKTYCHCHIAKGKYKDVVKNNSNSLYAIHNIDFKTISNDEILEKEKDFLFILPIEPSFILWESKFIKFVFDNPIKDDKCIKELLDTFQGIFTIQQPM